MDSNSRSEAIDKMAAEVTMWVRGSLRRVIDDCEPTDELVDWVESRMEAATTEAAEADSVEDTVAALAGGLGDVLRRSIDDCDPSEETHDWLMQQYYTARKATEIA